MKATKRCAWAQSHPLLESYHDQEWGVPIHDDVDWYGKLLLDGAQAGLSWLTILKKRDAYRDAFCGFDPARVACFGPADVERLLQNEGIVRNRLKVASAIGNARAFLEIQREFGSFDAYIWQAAGGAPIHNRRRSMREVPAKTPLSHAISKDLKRRGFKFVGSTIVYAFLQAAGVVNDHLVTCFRHEQVTDAERPVRRSSRKTETRARALTTKALG